MSTLAGLCKGPKGEPDALDGVSEGLRAELLTLTSSGSVRLAHWRARRHDVSAELYAWLNREYARLGPYRRGREGEREQHALTRRGLTLEKCRLEDAGPGGPGVSINRHPPVSPLDRGGEQPVYRRLDRAGVGVEQSREGVGNHDRLASRSAHPLHRTRVVAAGRGHEPRPVPDL